MFTSGTATDIDEWLKSLDPTPKVDLAPPRRHVMMNKAATLPNLFSPIDAKTADAGAGAADFEPRFIDLDSPLTSPLPGFAAPPVSSLPSEPGVYGLHPGGGGVAAAAAGRPATPLSPLMDEDSILRELDSLVTPGSPGPWGGGPWGPGSPGPWGGDVPRQRSWSIGSLGSDSGMMGISSAVGPGAMVPYGAAPSPGAVRRPIAADGMQGIDGISAEFLGSLSATGTNLPPASFGAAGYGGAAAAAAGPGSIVMYSPAAAAAASWVKLEPGSGGGYDGGYDGLDPEVEHAVPSDVDLGVIPDNLHELSETQLAYVDYKTLGKLMAKARLSEADAKEIKVQRRKLKNRRSAKMCSGKKKVHVAQTREKNNILSEALTQSEAENRGLRAEVAMFSQALKAANADRAAMAERIRVLEAVATSGVPLL